MFLVDKLFSLFQLYNNPFNHRGQYVDDHRGFVKQLEFN